MSSASLLWFFFNLFSSNSELSLFSWRWVAVVQVNLHEPASLQPLHEFGHLIALIKAFRLIPLVKDWLRQQWERRASFHFAQGQTDCKVLYLHVTCLLAVGSGYPYDMRQGKVLFLSDFKHQLVKYQHVRTAYTVTDRTGPAPTDPFYKFSVPYHCCVFWIITVTARLSVWQHQSRCYCALFLTSVGTFNCPWQ